ncbi:hypothetical protein [Lysinibacillus fusiformis]
MNRHKKIRGHIVKVLKAQGVSQIDGKPIENLSDRALLKAITKH